MCSYLPNIWVPKQTSSDIRVSLEKKSNLLTPSSFGENTTEKTWDKRQRPWLRPVHSCLFICILTMKSIFALTVKLVKTCSTGCTDQRCSIINVFSFSDSVHDGGQLDCGRLFFYWSKIKPKPHISHRNCTKNFRAYKLVPPAHTQKNLVHEMEKRTFELK